MTHTCWWAACAVLSAAAVLCAESGDGGEAPGDVPLWNAEATSKVLNKAELLKLADGFPDWKIAQLVWPELDQLAAVRATASEEVVEDCLRWIRRFLRADVVPAGLREHLVALRRWGQIGEKSRGWGLCDVFIVRFRVGNRVIHLQDSPYNLVIGVAEEPPAEAAATEHKEYVVQTADAILRDVLLPNEQIAPIGVHGSEIHSLPLNSQVRLSQIYWTVPCVVSKRRDNRATAISGLVEASIGTAHVGADTDGRFVRFDILKAPEGPRADFDPYAERFPVETQ